MIQVNCIIYTEKYIDKIIKPVKKYGGIIIEMKQSYIQKEFESMKSAYFTKIQFRERENLKKCLSYLKYKTSKKYDFFLEVV